MNNKLSVWLFFGILLGIVGVGLYFSGDNYSLISAAARGGSAFLPLIVVSALVDSINPCAFSVLLLTIAFLFSLGHTRNNILKIGSAYVFGIFAVYILIGLGILRVLSFFNIPGFMGKVGASLLIAAGALDLVNTYFPGFPVKLKIPASSHRTMARLMERASLPTAFALGAFVGLCEFPCTGGPYLTVLGLLHDARTYLSGFGYLVFYNLIFVFPLAVILVVASHEKLLARVEAWKKGETGLMRFVSGIAMIALGALIFLL